MKPLFLTARSLGSLVGLGPDMIRKLARHGKIPGAVKPRGCNWQFPLGTEHTPELLNRPKLGSGSKKISKEEAVEIVLKYRSVKTVKKFIFKRCKAADQFNVLAAWIEGGDHGKRAY